MVADFNYNNFLDITCNHDNEDHNRVTLKFMVYFYVSNKDFFLNDNLVFMNVNVSLCSLTELFS